MMDDGTCTSGLNENLVICSKTKLSELKKLISDHGVTTRGYEWFLDRFISLGRQNVQRAFNKIQKYENFRKKYNTEWLHINIRLVREVLESKCIVILNGTDKKGRKIMWLRLGKWDPDVYSADTILQVAGLIAEIHLLLYKFKPLSVLILFDMNDFGMRHINALSSRFAKKMVMFITESSPVEIPSIFVLRESKFFSLIYSCFKPFLDDKMKKNIKLFGQDFNSLQDYIHTDNLPEEFGGSCGGESPEKWIRIIEKPSIQEELSKAGYVFG